MCVLTKPEVQTLWSAWSSPLSFCGLFCARKYASENSYVSTCSDRARSWSMWWQWPTAGTALRWWCTHSVTWGRSCQTWESVPHHESHSHLQENMFPTLIITKIILNKNQKKKNPVITHSSMFMHMKHNLSVSLMTVINIYNVTEVNIKWFSTFRMWATLP